MVMPASRRSKLYRRRKRRGARSVWLTVEQQDIAALAKRGYLESEKASPAEIRDAVQSFMSDQFSA